MGCGASAGASHGVVSPRSGPIGTTEVQSIEIKARSASGMDATAALSDEATQKATARALLGGSISPAGVGMPAAAYAAAGANGTGSRLSMNGRNSLLHPNGGSAAAAALILFDPKSAYHN